MDSAFTEPIKLPASPTASLTIPPPIPAPITQADLAQSEPAPPSTEASVSDETWKQQYDAYVAEWRAASAVAREKAEETRSKFEVVRAQEEAKKLAEGGSKGKGKDGAAGGWEDVHPGRQPLPRPSGSPSPADARDLVTGEREGHIHFGAGHGQGHGSSPPASLSQWEDVPSMASSFPSLPSQETSPPSRHRQHPSAQTDSLPPSSAPESSPKEKETRPVKDSKATVLDPSRSQVAGPSTKRQTPAVTPVIFDPNVPVKTRILAMFSSLAINMFLPFVNGVMLGFGEIFARNVVGPWFGWKVINPNATRPTLRPKLVSDAERLERIRRERLSKAEEL